MSEQPQTAQRDDGPLTDAAPVDAKDDSATTPSPRRRRGWRWVALLLLVLLGGGPLYYYGFNNWTCHGQDWIAADIDQTINRALDYVYQAGVFGESVDKVAFDGNRVHHWFLERVLDRQDHPGLRQQMARAKEINRDNIYWRLYAGLPGWPTPEFSRAEWAQIREGVRNAPFDRRHGVWVIYAMYPGQIPLTDRHRQCLFEDTGKLETGYDLTHALICYLWLKQMNPDLAAQLEVDRLIGEINRRLYRQHSWDARPGDLYNERVAFWLYMDDGPPVRPRWIERIMLTQNTDGSWTFNPDELRLLVQMIGLTGNGDSDCHATLLALCALVEYRERLRQEGLYPPRRAAAPSR